MDININICFNRNIYIYIHIQLFIYIYIYMHTGLRVTGRLVCSGQIIAGEASRSLSSAPSEWGCQPSWSTSGGNRGSTTDHDWETAGEDSADWSRSDWSYFGAPRIRNARMCGRQYIYIYIHTYRYIPRDFGESFTAISTVSIWYIYIYIYIRISISSILIPIRVCTRTPFH